MITLHVEPLLAEMETLTGPHQDPEAAHGRADDLLCETLTAMATALDQDGRQPEANTLRRLVAAYADVPKWYA